MKKNISHECKKNIFNGKDIQTKKTYPLEKIHLNELLLYKCQLLMLTYLKPSEIASALSLVYPTVKDRFDVWHDLAFIAYKVRLEESVLEQEKLSPFDAYLRLFTQEERIDYGSERYYKSEWYVLNHGNIGVPAYCALKEGDIDLCRYFMDLSQAVGFSSEDFIRAFCLAEAAAASPNFFESLDFLLRAGIGNDDIEQAWIHYYVIESKYEELKSLLLNSPGEITYPNASCAFTCAIIENKADIARKIAREFTFKNHGEDALFAIENDNPELLSVVFDLPLSVLTSPSMPSFREVLQYCLQEAQERGKGKIAEDVKGRLMRLDC